MPIQQLPISYYTGLITSEYKNSIKFQAWLKSVLQIQYDISLCLSTIGDAFDLDTAEGAQLDILGQIVGVSRIAPFQPTDSVSPILDDDTYRILIKATIANDHWDGKIGSLYPLWSFLFPGGRITILDHQDMSATIIMTGAFTSIVKDLIAHEMIVPRPEAVKYNYEFGDLPMFGFDRDDEFIAGFDIGKWS